VDLPALAADAIRLALSLALPALIAALVVSVLLALFDVATQGQDPSVSFAPRLLAIALVLYLGRDFLGSELVHFTQTVVRDISLVRR
jgi:flagellar biosynthetic protein FliQ